MKMRLDQGSTFTSVRWTDRANASGTVVQTSGVESHNSLGSSEPYHAPLRCKFNKMILEDPITERQMAQKVAAKSMNDTMGPYGLVLSYLVLCCIPRFTAVESTVPNQRAV